MAVTLIAILVLNALKEKIGEKPVFYVTLPAAFVMFCWDVAYGWIHRHETREIAKKGRREVEHARAERAIREEDEVRRAGHSLVGSLLWQVKIASTDRTARMAPASASILAQDHNLLLDFSHPRTQTQPLVRAVYLSHQSLCSYQKTISHRTANQAVA